MEMAEGWVSCILYCIDIYVYKFFRVLSAMCSKLLQTSWSDNLHCCGDMVAQGPGIGFLLGYCLVHCRNAQVTETR